MQFKWNTKKHTYQMVGYKDIEEIKAKLSEKAHQDLVILDEEDYKTLRSARAEINGFVKEVATIRKQMTAVALSQFAPMMTEIERYGSELTTKMTEKINEFKPPKEREKTYKLIINTKDLKVVKKLKEIALANECEVEENY